MELKYESVGDSNLSLNPGVCHYKDRSRLGSQNSALAKKHGNVSHEDSMFARRMTSRCYAHDHFLKH